MNRIRMSKFLFLLLFSVMPIMATTLWSDTTDSQVDIVDDQFSQYAEHFDSLFDEFVPTFIDVFDSKLDVIEDEFSFFDSMMDSQLDTFESKVDWLASHDPTYFQQEDVVGGTLTISASGNYAFRENITATINIEASCVWLDMSDLKLTGWVNVNGDYDDIIIRNGRINVPSTATTGIYLGSSVDYALINNMKIWCDTKTSGNGTPGLSILGSNVHVYNCTCAGGATTGNGADGGSGIYINGAEDVVLNDCVANGGNGGDSTTSADGGDGGNGFYCVGGINVVLQDNLVQSTGTGGDSSGGGNGGNGGHGVYLDATCDRIGVFNCTMLSTASGGTGAVAGAGGKAVLDAVTGLATDKSTVVGNIALNVSNSIKFDLVATGVEQGVALSYPPKTPVTNMWVNYYIS